MPRWERACPCTPTPTPTPIPFLLCTLYTLHLLHPLHPSPLLLPPGQALVTANTSLGPEDRAALYLVHLTGTQSFREDRGRIHISSGDFVSSSEVEWFSTTGAPDSVMDRASLELELDGSTLCLLPQTSEEAPGKTSGKVGG